MVNVSSPVFEVPPEVAEVARGIADGLKALAEAQKAQAAAAQAAAGAPAPPAPRPPRRITIEGPGGEYTAVVSEDAPAEGE